MKQIILFLLVIFSIQLCFGFQHMPEKKDFKKEDLDYFYRQIQRNHHFSLDSTKHFLSGGTMHYVMSQNFEGLIDFYNKMSSYAQSKGYTKIYEDVMSNRGQAIMTYRSYEEGIAELEDFISKHNSSDTLKMKVFKALGDAYRVIRKPEESKNYFEKSLEFAKSLKDTFMIANNYISMAFMEERFGNNYNAIDLDIKALNILQGTNNAYLTAGTCSSLSNIFSELGNIDKALEYGLRMKDLCEMKNYTIMRSHAYSNLGKLYTKTQQVDSALVYYKKWEEIVDSGQKFQFDDPGTPYYSIPIYSDIANIYLNKKDYKNASLYIEKAKSKGLEKVEPSRLLPYYASLVKLKTANGNYDGAEESFRLLSGMMENETNKSNKKHLFIIERNIAKAKGDLARELAIVENINVLEDSIDLENKEQLILNLEAKYRRAEQEKEISELSAENIKTEARLKARNRLIIVSLVGLFILSLLLISLYNLNQKNKRFSNQLQEQNEIINKALEDKNTLLKEIHHRVKNNLQVISSLLSLQSRMVKDKETVDAINAGKSRVQSMSLLHQNLYRDDNLKGVEMKDYFKNLAQNLFDTYKINDNIEFTSEVDDITLDIDTVVPIGLITNELISNSLKYAFEGRERGRIFLQLKEENDHLRLILEDDGIGLPDSELPISNKSIGATLIHSFVDKLEGSMKIDNSNGTKIDIVINDYKRVG